jgi:uncharacterized protein YybS (DUF2232 family)
MAAEISRLIIELIMIGVFIYFISKNFEKINFYKQCLKDLKQKLEIVENQLDGLSSENNWSEDGYTLLIDQSKKNAPQKIAFVNSNIKCLQKYIASRLD